MNKIVACDGNVRIYEDVLPQEDVDALNKFFIEFNYDGLKPNQFGYWGKRLINSQTPFENPGYENCLDEMHPIMRRLRDATIDMLNDDVKLARWEPTSPNFIKMWKDSNPGIAFDKSEELEMFYHIDNQEHMEKPIHWASVYYPNSNYEGGEICYPDYDYMYKPKANSVAFHSGMTLHGVKKVISGERFCLASLIMIENVWNENPKPVATNNPLDPWHYPPGYWGKRMPTDSIQGDIKVLRSNGTTAPYNNNPVEGTHDSNKSEGTMM
jgi:hypothetical protein